MAHSYFSYLACCVIFLTFRLEISELSRILHESPYRNLENIYASHTASPHIFQIATSKWNYNLHTLFSHYLFLDKEKEETNMPIHASMMIYYGDCS